MNAYNKTSSALKLVPKTNTVKVYRKSKTPRSTIYSMVRKDIRNEAKLLRATGKCLLLLGVIGSGVMCAINGYLYHALLNSISTNYGGFDTSTGIAIVVVMCVAGLLFAGLCVFLALVLFGVAESLRQESKKIR